jgi:hypothetical protein
VAAPQPNSEPARKFGAIKCLANIGFHMVFQQRFPHRYGGVEQRQESPGTGTPVGWCKKTNHRKGDWFITGIG